MNTKVKLTLLAVASCCLAGLIVYIVTINRKVDKNLTLVRSNLHQAVENAKKGDRKELNAIIEAIARGDKRYISDKLLPDHLSFLKDTDGQIQLLGAQGLYGVQNPKSKEPIVDYLKSKDFTKIKEELRSGQFDEQQAEWQGRASSIAILTLGETGDKSVIPLLESLRGVRDLQFEWGGGLVAGGSEPLKGFAIAGADRKFVWADAKIEGGTVVVGSGKVPEPVAVRYAWADNPACNLYNKEGLPASPFRTDDWPGITANQK